MLLGHIHTPNTYEPFLQHPVWQKVLTWINIEAPKLQDGEYEIDGRNIYAPISTIQTMSQEQTIYEAHRQYIDVHYCLEGGEIIDWTPVNQLTPTMEFDTAKDYCLYESPREATSLLMAPGTFAIFFPADAHMPKISDGKNTQIRKAVVKIKASIL
ncbi:MAG: YhcH/YjgK/YiaL family protein [Candidatus Andersenbacteria bacterium]|nr:YhcH/YjgK/YiaL family protein [Candidatus Andersenbacteria bacterium]